MNLQKLISRTRRRLTLTKREKFAIIAFILTIGLVATQMVAFEDRLKMVGLLFLLTYLLSAWGLYSDLTSIEWFTLLILPSFFTTAVALFYFLLPIRWITRLPTAAFYGIGIYALLLIGNIYNVAVERSIQLVRAANAIGLLLSVVTVFLTLNTIFALRLYGFVNFLLIFLFLLPLIYQQLWVVTLENRVSWRLFIFTSGVALSVAEVALVISFWPVKTVIASLFLATIYYCFVGITQQYLVERLFRATFRNFFISAIFVSIILVLTTQWGG